MPFQIGNKHGTVPKAGKGVGRPKKGQKAASQIVREIIEGNATALGRRYIQRSLGKSGDRVLCHAIDKLLPEVILDANQQPIAIQVIVEGNSGAAHAPAQSEGNGRSVLAIGSNGGES